MVEGDYVCEAARAESVRKGNVRGGDNAVVRRFVIRGRSVKIVLDSQGENTTPSLVRNGVARVLEVYSLVEENHPLQLPSEVIQKRIIGVRGIPVMLDRDLAELYGVPVKRLNEQVSRNIERFPEPFMFQLTATEVTDLKSHFATSSWGGVRKPPKVFSEQGLAMLSAVLNLKTAVTVSIAIMDAFVKMRRFQLSNSEMLCRIMGDRAQYVEMSGTGHNALDFHIAYYIGRISANDKDAYFHIISNDQGFDPLIAHLKQECVFADRVTKIASIPALFQASMISKTPLSVLHSPGSDCRVPTRRVLGHAKRS